MRGFRAAAAAAAAAVVAADCVFTQTCYPGGTDGCLPLPVVGNQSIPQPFIPGLFETFTCPQYSSAACCTHDQNTALQTNFVEIYSGFNLLGGNMACVANLEALWCAFTCSPDQDRFVSVDGIVNMTDPNSGAVHTVLLTTVLLEPYYACGVWESCRDTFTSEIASFSTCEQFLNYQVQAAIPSGSFSSFNYSGSLPSAAAAPSGTGTGTGKKIPLTTALQGLGAAVGVGGGRGLFPWSTKPASQVVKESLAARQRAGAAGDAAAAAGVVSLPVPVLDDRVVAALTGGNDAADASSVAIEHPPVAWLPPARPPPRAPRADDAASPVPLSVSVLPDWYLSIPLYDCCSFPADLTHPTAGNTSAPCAFCAGMCGNPQDTCYTNPDWSPGAGGGASSSSNTTASGPIDAVTLSVWNGFSWQAVAGMYIAVGALIMMREAFGFCCGRQATTDDATGEPRNRCGCRPAYGAASGGGSSGGHPRKGSTLYEADAAMRERFISHSSINGGAVGAVDDHDGGRATVFSMPVVRGPTTAMRDD